jgi:hypothetical protein
MNFASRRRVPRAASGGRGTRVRKPEKYPIQIRLSDADRRRIKSFAAKQGMTLQDAVVEAFNAWAEKLRTQPHAQHSPKAPQPKPPAPYEFEPLPASLPPDWLKQALRLDWTKCSAVELVSDGENRYWMLCESDAPLSVVLRAVADGIPATEIAEVFELELLQLAKVLEFALPLGRLTTENQQLAD